MNSEAAAVAATFSSSAPETISRFVLCAHGTVLTELSKGGNRGCENLI